MAGVGPLCERVRRGGDLGRLFSLRRRIFGGLLLRARSVSGAPAPSPCMVLPFPTGELAKGWSHRGLQVAGSLGEATPNGSRWASNSRRCCLYHREESRKWSFSSEGSKPASHLGEALCSQRLSGVRLGCVTVGRRARSGRLSQEKVVASLQKKPCTCCGVCFLFYGRNEVVSSHWHIRRALQILCTVFRR